MNDPQQPAVPVAAADAVTLRRTEYEALIAELEDAEDRIASLEHDLAIANGTAPEPLTIYEADRIIAGESPVKIWREKRGLTQRALAGIAGISASLLAEIESGAKTGSVETLRKLAHELKVDLDTLVP
ncbi:MAG: helix-turn-helix transcriptional regulator [Acidisphaera sp.]|nr:helix-turn-helix transcriptional regulator [Acidisphaera sp.]